MRRKIGELTLKEASVLCKECFSKNGLDGEFCVGCPFDVDSMGEKCRPFFTQNDEELDMLIESKGEVE